MMSPSSFNVLKYYKSLNEVEVGIAQKLLCWLPRSLITSTDNKDEDNFGSMTPHRLT